MIMSLSTAKPKKGNSVRTKTFKNWGFSTIGFIEESGDVVEVWCKTCSKHAAKICSQLKGKAALDINSFIEGTNFVTKFTLQRHLGSRAHTIGTELERLDSNYRPNCDQSDDVDHDAACSQPRIHMALQEQSTEAYTKLMKTAYLMALHGQPLTNFKTSDFR